MTKVYEATFTQLSQHIGAAPLRVLRAGFVGWAFELPHQLAERQPERGGYGLGTLEGGAAFAALQHADEGAVELRAVGELFLRDALLLAELAHGAAEPGREVDGMALGARWGVPPGTRGGGPGHAHTVGTSGDVAHGL